MSTNQEQTQTKQFDDNMRGVLYKNTKKTETKHPNARGRAQVDGIWYWMSSWTQHGKQSGEKYQSIAFTKMTDDEVTHYITNRAQNAGNSGAATGANTNTNTAANNPTGDENSYQQYQEYNTDGSVRQPNNIQDFDQDIPF